MATAVDIANMALGEIADDTITALSDSNERARRCNQYYAQARDEVLQLYPWAFALKKSHLLYNGAELDVSDEVTKPTGLFFRPDGKKMFVCDQDSAVIYEYDLSTPWDITTAEYTSGDNIDLSANVTSLKGFFINDIGQRLYVFDLTTNTIYQYTMSEPWDISTAVYDTKSYDPSAQVTNLSDAIFRPTGTTMYVLDSSKDAIFQYTLSTAWDVSTATYANKTYDFTASPFITGNSTGFAINTDGDKIIVCDKYSDSITEYDLSTAWDISTASYSSIKKDISSVEQDMEALFINPDGTRIFVTGLDKNVAHFGLGAAYDVSMLEIGSDDFGYPYKMAPPADMLRPHLDSHSSTQQEPIWEHEGGFIVSDNKTVNLVYIAQITDTTKFTPLFIKALVLNLAAYLAVSIKGDRNLKNVLIAERDAVIREAELVDARSGNSRDYDANEGWTDREGGNI